MKKFFLVILTVAVAAGVIFGVVSKKEAKAGEKNAKDEEKLEAEAEKVDALISKIGDVSLDSKGDIEKADKAYKKLSKEGRKYVYLKASLKDAKADFKKTEESAKARTSAVTDKINAIGDVTLDSEGAIVEARNAFNDLTDPEKKMVDEAALQNAESALQTAKDEKAKADAEAAAAAVKKQAATTRRAAASAAKKQTATTRRAAASEPAADSNGSAGNTAPAASGSEWVEYVPNDLIPGATLKVTHHADGTISQEPAN